MNVGVVGTGFGRRVVAPAFAETEGCTVVDVVSARDESAVATLAARPDVDLLSIHSPPFLHAPHVRHAVANGKAVLCDKPFTTCVEDAATLEREAEAAGVVNLVNFEFRYHPARRLVRDLVAGGTLGAIEHISWTHISSGTRYPLRPYGWLFDRARGGGWIGAWASHAVDMLRFGFGEVENAAGYPRTTIAARPDADGVMHECTAEDALTAALTLTTGTTVAIDSTFAAAANVAPRLVVTGSDAVMEIVADARITRRAVGRDPEEVTIAQGAGGADRHAAPMHAWAAVVRNAVEHRQIPDGTPTFADGRACRAVLDRLSSPPNPTRSEDA